MELASFNSNFIGFFERCILMTNEDQLKASPSAWVEIFRNNLQDLEWKELFRKTKNVLIKKISKIYPIYCLANCLTNLFPGFKIDQNVKLYSFSLQYQPSWRQPWKHFHSNISLQLRGTWSCIKYVFSILGKEFFLTLHKKLKFCSKDFFSKCDQIRIKLQIRSNLLKKSVMKNLFFLCSLSLVY